MPDLAYVVMPDLIGHLLRHCRPRPFVIAGPDRQSNLTVITVIADLTGNLLRTGREWGRRDTKS